MAGWDAVLAEEHDNTYSGWFDAPSDAVSATGGNGGVLEGVLDLTSGTAGYPFEIHLAVGLYGNANGGALLSTHQIAASKDGDGVLEADEFVRIPLPELALALDVAQGSATQAAKGRPLIAGNVRVVKTGSGTLVFDAANRYSGDTTVSAGTLLVSGSGAMTGSRRLLVEAGGVLDVSGMAGGLALGSGQTLAGTGSVAGSVVFGRGATLSPGNASGLGGTALPGTALGADGLQGSVAVAPFAAVPEPGSLVLALVGLAGGGLSVGRLRRRGER
ncbi:MAG: autotransporter-associated beta strand repeat-containing protein [Planctomycetaceae bacterium]